MPKATGQLMLTPEGCDLVLGRAFESPVEDVWASIADPDRLDTWFGRWSGEAGPGRTVQVVMRFEATDEPQAVVIEDCRPPRFLRVRMGEGAAIWRMSLEITPGPLGAGLRLSHHLSDPATAATVGPGWDYYLDMLSAARAGRQLPTWEDYHPALVDRYEQIAAEFAE